MQKIEWLRTLDKACRLFGASTHRYELNASLKPEEVAAFEERHNVCLPEDYKDFILNVGNGGTLSPCTCDKVTATLFVPRSRRALPNRGKRRYATPMHRTNPHRAHMSRQRPRG
jgi:hypothetical protein